MQFVHLLLNGTQMTQIKQIYTDRERREGDKVWRMNIFIKIYYHNHLVGEYFADLIIDRMVIVELKAAETIQQAHITQLQNYLRATQLEVGLLLNFGRRPEIKRRIFTNDQKIS
ncbi:MAG: GxxExxY protein [Blastocatellia bacterium]|nr:GxxExxY protein [Blastocatellia bacterium]